MRPDLDARAPLDGAPNPLSDQPLDGASTPATPATPATPHLLTAREAAAYLGIAPQTLATYRYYGHGPAWRSSPGGASRWGYQVRYALEDLDAWRAGQVPR
jgi:hypothetical protein